jgi:two-component system, response regulator, stage 0 sporulation protein F
METLILLVDDDAMVLRLIQHMLQDVAPDYKLITVSNGAAALAVLAQRPIALVITDQHMPGMDGLALAQAIKATTPHCPVILLTGSVTPELQLRGKAAGVEYFLPKPFRLQQLASLVKVALAIWC